ncbi:UDP-3-O-(3-hydroxymyristoyl)glucosamine N-acyltransferase [Merismopedia glauca]|uniref:UDP-3-O-acylglucosamine N-acyltransferase n=1 Tax=Merismopedia glauca CCAP 1448/3 TaxID=1296344 RepID=A0A2T1C527_9CYAN|nr:UDP-3-O-(3-hydroxymyristoyl)glucosamine N-acyltransferase [Merismopedia glauca]PSB03356.1 UDP-3-O-(3-hydroxymyristoyl)glucosamine N-acyltransferase [Merismopedia glauca CCAP 1448/3]
MKFSELVQKIGAKATKNSLELNPDSDMEIVGIAPIDDAKSGTISYIEGKKYASYVDKTGASALILPEDSGLQDKATARGIAWMAAPETRLVFAEAIALFYQPFLPQPQIHSTAVIDSTATIGKDCYIGAHVAIEAAVKIGDRVSIYPNVVIYPEVQIGNDTILHANCTIHERSQIGSNCVIHSGAVIGAEGFGFVPTPTGWFKMEQSGYTILENGVEVGCNSTVDRPAVGETRIKQDTKLDNLVHIGHGCTIGSNTAIAAQVGLAGGVKVGNNVLLAGQVGISNQAEIGDGAIATAKAGIHSNVAAGTMVTGIPAIPHKLFLKATAVYNRLPEMYQSLKELQKRSSP